MDRYEVEGNEALDTRVKQTGTVRYLRPQSVDRTDCQGRPTTATPLTSRDSQPSVSCWTPIVADQTHLRTSVTLVWCCIRLPYTRGLCHSFEYMFLNLIISWVTLNSICFIYGVTT